MEDDQEQKRPGETDERTFTAKPLKRRRRRWPLVVIGVVVVLPLLLMAAWTSISLNWVYSSGQRTGFVQKFSHKGWVCKTWEGEIATVTLPGAVQERFAFTVRDDSVAKEINRIMGSRVSIEYAEHRGIPGSCFGETQYYVVGVRVLP